jgi:hypothetical protein
MATRLPIAPLPFPPSEYNNIYFAEMIRTLNLHFRQLQNPGALLGSTLTVSHLPTSATGLASGEVWVDTGAGNVLKVVP